MEEEFIEIVDEWMLEKDPGERVEDNTIRIWHVPCAEWNPDPWNPDPFCPKGFPSGTLTNFTNFDRLISTEEINTCKKCKKKLPKQIKILAYLWRI